MYAINYTSNEKKIHLTYINIIEESWSTNILRKREDDYEPEKALVRVSNSSGWAILGFGFGVGVGLGVRQWVGWRPSLPSYIYINPKGHFGHLNFKSCLGASQPLPI